MDVRLQRGRVHEIRADLEPAPGESTIDAAGGVLLPGLHDHHVHLLSLAASRRSLRCGPDRVRDAAELAAALRAAPACEGWIRGIGYHESVAGGLDRWRLDALLGDRADTRVRIQHRSGSLWILGSAALASLDLPDEAFPPGAERDGAVREHLPAEPGPDLAETSRWLAALGVSGVTDATPGNGTRELELFSTAMARGALRQRLYLMGGVDLVLPAASEIRPGPYKIHLDEPDLPDFDELVAELRRSHGARRPVAIHCVTRTELALACAAWKQAGSFPGDRVEHASVAPPDLVELVAELGLTIVTQPHFVFERGDAYLEDVEARDRAWLYRCAGWLDAGVALGAGTDAPFGAADPWRAMRAAVDRRTRGGRGLGAGESLSPERALELFTTHPEAPGAAPRRVEVGLEADLCLLERPWAQARERLSGDDVRATWVGGELVFDRGAGGST